MKVIDTNLLAAYRSGSTTLAYLLTITRSNGQVLRLTSLNQDTTYDGEVYLSAVGLDVSNIVLTNGYAPDNLELRVLGENSYITRDDMVSGRYDNATFSLIIWDYEGGGSPWEQETLLTGTLGELKATHDAGFTVELRSLKQAFQRPVGQVVQKTCRYRLGSTAMPEGLCLKDLTAFTDSGVAITGVTSNRAFTASSLAAKAADYYVEGTVEFTSGGNSGITRKVKTFSAGVFALASPLPFLPEVGDTFTAIAGCRKRLADCRDKFDNVLNFGGEPHLVGIDSLSAPPDVGAGG